MCRYLLVWVLLFALVGTPYFVWLLWRSRL